MKSRAPQPSPDFLHKRMIEGAAIFLFSVSIILLLALASYQPEVESRNAGGRVGTWFADTFLFTFGYFAYVFPLMLAYVAWLILKERHHFKIDKRLLSLRATGMVMILAAGCSLANLQQISGGFLGRLIANGVMLAFNAPGSVLLLSACFLVGVTLFTGLSWPVVLERLGKRVLIILAAIPGVVKRVITRVQSIISKQLQRRKEKRVLQSIRRKNAEKIAPQISVPAPKAKPSKRYQKERQAELFIPTEPGSLPPLSLLDPPSKTKAQGFSKAELEMISREVEQRLADFGVSVQVVAVQPGPVITRFELELAPGIKASKITGLAKDLARSLSVTSVRVVEVIPGKPVVGLELPNKSRDVVRLSEVLMSENYEQSKTTLTLALGVDIAGVPYMVDLAKMPHLLVAGTTGSGKSVGLNAMLLSLLYKLTPQDLRLIMIDPKMLELSIYEGIPHLLTPVVTDMKDAANALRWCVGEMERRYRLMANLGVRNLSGYNQKIKDAEKKNQPITDPFWESDGSRDQAPNLETMPFIVVVIDELADMMMVVGKKVEQLIARIAQKARAAGIHLILATQRPSVDVLTGLIKSNIPTRIAFQVSSKIDSRTILDQQGADQLLGHGDMLYLPPGSGNPIRVHGAFVDDQEVHRVTDDWKRRGAPQYIDDILDSAGGEGGAEFGMVGELGGDLEDRDPLYDETVEFILQSRKSSISAVQRRFKIGYNRAARLLEEMERTGILSPMESNGTREILVTAPQTE